MTPLATKQLVEGMDGNIGDIRFSTRNLEAETNGRWIACDGRNLSVEAYPELCSSPAISWRIPDVKSWYLALGSSNTYFPNENRDNAIVKGDFIYILYVNNGYLLCITRSLTDVSNVVVNTTGLVAYAVPYCWVKNNKIYFCTIAGTSFTTYEWSGGTSIPISLHTLTVSKSYANDSGKWKYSAQKLDDTRVAITLYYQYYVSYAQYQYMLIILNEEAAIPNELIMPNNSLNVHLTSSISYPSMVQKSKNGNIVVVEERCPNGKPDLVSIYISTDGENVIVRAEICAVEMLPGAGLAATSFPQIRGFSVYNNNAYLLFSRAQYTYNSITYSTMYYLYRINLENPNNKTRWNIEEAHTSVYNAVATNKLATVPNTGNLVVVDEKTAVIIDTGRLLKIDLSSPSKNLLTSDIASEVSIRSDDITSAVSIKASVGNNGFIQIKPGVLLSSATVYNTTYKGAQPNTGDGTRLWFLNNMATLELSKFPYSSTSAPAISTYAILRNEDNSELYFLVSNRTDSDLRFYINKLQINGYRVNLQMPASYIKAKEETE